VPPSGGWILTEWSDGNRQNPRTIIPTDHTNLQAKYKAHLASNSTAALATNQQRKIARVRWDDGTQHYTILYESAGQIWDLTSTNLTAATWYPEKRISTNSGVNKNPSMLRRSTYLQYVWHGSDNGVDRIYTKGMISSLEVVAQTNVYPGVPPAPVIAIKNRPSGPTNETDRFVLAWTSAEGIEVYKKPTASTGPWQRDPISNRLQARLRPSLSDGDDGFAVCLSYDNARGVYVDVYRQYCTIENCWNAWRSDYFQETEVPGSRPPNLLFSGKSQVVVFPYPDYFYAGIVWQMNEKYPDQDSPEPQLEELNADVIDENQPVPYGTQSVCFQRWDWWSNQWQPLNKFVGTFYQSPTISSFGDGRLVMLWTDGARALKTESTNNGGTWSPPTVLRDGVDPNIMTTGGAYAYRGTSGPIYEIGAEILTAPEPQGNDTDTREITVYDQSTGTVALDDPAISIELSSLKLKTVSGNIQSLPFLIAPDSNFSASLDNLPLYLSTLPFLISEDADSIFIKVRLRSTRAASLASSNGRVRVKFQFTPNLGSARYTATLWRFDNDHYFYKTLRVPAHAFRNHIVGFHVSIHGLNRANAGLRASAARIHYPPHSAHLKPSIGANGQDSPSVPEVFALAQNHPNPFNPRTVIDYQLPVDAHVVLKVYDLLGRVVATLVDEQKPAGYHRATFDATAVGSSVYFYRMSAGNYTAVRKMVVVK